MSDLHHPHWWDPNKGVEPSKSETDSDEVEDVYSFDNNASVWLLEDNEKQSEPLFLSDDKNDGGNENENDTEKKDDVDEPIKNKLGLLVSLIVMVGTGILNVIYGKLQMIPMYNYPSFLSIFESIVFIPMIYAVFLPMNRMGQISTDQFKLSKIPFAIMGFLDGLTGLMQVFACDYISGPLIALIPQATIPISLVLSKFMLKKKYNMGQIFGAIIVIMGILIALGQSLTNSNGSSHLCLPNFGDDDCAVCHSETSEVACLSHLVKSEDDTSKPSIDFLYSIVNNNIELGSVQSKSHTSNSNCKWEASTESNSGAMSTLWWSLVMFLACIPQSISCIYKEREMEKRKLDPIYMSVWVANFQAIFTIALIIPAGFLVSPPVSATELLENFYHGFMCYIGYDRIKTGCHPDQCSDSMKFVNIFLFFNLILSIAVMYVLKFGSANIMVIGWTLVVPASNLAFSLPFIPQSIPLNLMDVWGLITIMIGIISFRFGSNLYTMIKDLEF